VGRLATATRHHPSTSAPIPAVLTPLTMTPRSNSLPKSPWRKNIQNNTPALACELQAARP
jgi:hypothetical protein